MMYLKYDKQRGLWYVTHTVSGYALADFSMKFRKAAPMYHKGIKGCYIESKDESIVLYTALSFAAYCKMELELE